MFDTSARLLKIFAATTWYCGAVVLLLKGVSLLQEAASMEQDRFWIWLTIALGLLIGSVKAKYIFSKIGYLLPDLYKKFRQRKPTEIIELSEANKKRLQIPGLCSIDYLEKGVGVPGEQDLRDMGFSDPDILITAIQKKGLNIPDTDSGVPLSADLIITETFSSELHPNSRQSLLTLKFPRESADKSSSSKVK